MNEIMFSAEQYKDMFRAGIITEDDLCLMVESLTTPPPPTIEDIPKSKVAESIKWGNKLMLGIGVTTLTSAAMEKTLPVDMNPIARLIAKYTAGAILGGLAAVAAKEFDGQVDSAHLMLHNIAEVRKATKPAKPKKANKRGHKSKEEAH